MGELLVEQLSVLKKFRQKLQDNESVEIFDSRINFLVDRDGKKLCESVKSIVLKKKLKLERNLEEFLRKGEGKKVIIFGAGFFGRYTKDILNNVGIEVDFYCDNNRKLQGSIIDGLNVLDPEELVYDYNDCLVIIGIPGGQECYVQLINSFFPTENIFLPRNGMTVAVCGHQYFDCSCMQSSNCEFFVDGGGFDGESSLDFIQWCGGRYSQIYLFEPNKKNMIVCKNNLQKEDNVSFFEMGLAESERVLNFNNAGPASRFNENGEETIRVTSIDKAVNGRVDFIKLDIEGLELLALQGAESTIKAYYPNLAISMYHRPQDFVEIPYYLTEIAPKYNYCLRHYTTSLEETVLYAWK